MTYNFKELWNQQVLMQELVLYTLNVLNKKTIDAEICITKTVGININTRDYKLENLEFHNDSMIRIIVYKNLKKGIASSTDLSIQGINKTIDAAINIMKYTSIDCCSGLPPLNVLSFDSTNIKLFYPWEFNVIQVMKWLKEIEVSSLEYDSRILNIENTNFTSHINNYVFGNSYGMLQGYQRTLHSMSNCVIAKTSDDVMERDFSYTVARDINDLQTPIWVGKDSSKKVISRLYSKKIKTMKCPIIISSQITDEFFSHFITAINGMNVYRKSTILLNCLNKKIFPNWLNIIEYPHLDKGLSSKPFDSEGVKTKKRTIVRHGILQTWLLNNYSANKLELFSTGHAGGIYNWFVLGASNISFKNLLKDMYTGLIVTEFMGQGVNIVTGNYSKGVFGYWVEHGKIQYPVNEITISGNLKTMWKNIIDISNDTETRTGINCGSILLSDMQVSGI